MRRTRFSNPEHSWLLAGPSWSFCEGLIKAFEDAWQRGQAPAVADFLRTGRASLSDPERRALLVELLHVDLEFRLKAGEPVRVETYLTAHPELAGDRGATLGLIAAEYEQRQLLQRGVSLNEYRQRFPGYVDELLKRLPLEGMATQLPPPRTAAAGPPGWPAVAGYEILCELGRGGMGIVYKAHEPSLGRHVALKFLPAEYASDPDRLQRFLREARTASALNHPHICTIYALGEHQGRPFLVMEFIEGLTLHELAAQRPDVEEAARLIGQAARALAAAHAAGVVHRDIKPENIMVRADGYVKVLDFGLARRLPTFAGPQSARSHDTDPGALLGTAAYMSPEQARGERVDSASDVFSLGTVLYQLATGHHPFEADSAFGLLHAITTRQPVPPSRLNPAIGAALGGLIGAMLHKDARLRPTAAQVEASLAARADRESDHVRESTQHPIVYREPELAALRAALTEADSGRGSFVCVAGEPGIGKTTLVEDFLDELTAPPPTPPSRGGQRGVLVARGHCSERLGGTEAYLPVLDALGNLIREERSGAVARLMKLVAPTWYAQITPALRPSDTGRQRDRATAAEEEEPDLLSSSGRALSQKAMLREFCTLLQEASRLGPLVLFFDDVHWADLSTVDLLSHLGRHCPGLRVLVVITYRPTELLLGPHPFHRVKQELQGKGVCTELALDFLSRADIDRYLALAFPGHALPADFAELIHARTEGSPLFMVDLLRYLRERGVIAESGGRWSLAQELPDLRQELPESARVVIQRKLDRLDDVDRWLLAVASVQGHEFDSAAVAGAISLGAAEVEERLQVLDHVHGLVRQVREYEFPDGTLTLRYAFVHVLYQQALYADLRPTRRATLSAALARTLEGHHGPGNTAGAAELACLYEVGRDFGRAARHAWLAAQNAARVFAHLEAALLARQGLAVLAKLPDTPDRARQEIPLLLALGVSLVATHGFAAPDVEATYLRAGALCHQVDDPATLFPVLYGLWNVYLVRGDLPRCRELATQMACRAQGQADPVYLLVAQNALQQPLFHAGEFAAARRHQEQGLALYDGQKHRTLTAVYGEDPGVGCLAYGAATLWHLGYPEQALRAVGAARGLAEELSNPFNSAQALYYGAFMHLCCRDVRRAGELAEALLEVCREEGFTLLLAGGMILHGRSLAEHGQLEEGLSRMRQGLADWRATGALSHRAYQLALLAEALGQEGQVEEGQSALAEALAIAVSTGERFWEAELHRLRGELLLLGAAEPSEQSAAEACFRQALEVARRQGTRPLELRAAMSLARLGQRLGRPDEARALLAEAYSGFTEGFQTPDLQEARELIGR
ncbi:MAG: protein kinase [Gemmataceae bacterium]|nr:protein kinase [Gemmataceae bacterium]